MEVEVTVVVVRRPLHLVQTTGEYQSCFKNVKLNENVFFQCNFPQKTNYQQLSYDLPDELLVLSVLCRGDVAWLRCVLLKKQVLLPTLPISSPAGCRPQRCHCRVRQPTCEGALQGQFRGQFLNSEIPNLGVDVDAHDPAFCPALVP